MAKKRPARKSGLWDDIKWRAAAGGLLCLGAGLLFLHPWGLLVLLASLGLYLYAGRSAGWDIFAEGRSTAALKNKSWHLPVLGLGMLGTLVCGIFLALAFGHEPVFQHQWARAAALAALALLCGLTASSALPSSARLIRQAALVPIPGWRLAAFWGACFMLTAGLPWSAGLGVFSLACLLALAPGFGTGDEPASRRGLQMGCAAVALLGLGLHLWDLAEIPQGINWEEFNTLALAHPVAEGMEGYFSTTASGYTGVTFYHNVVGWIYRLIQTREVIPLRLLSVLGWMVLLAYGTLLTARLFSWTAALGSAVYFSFSFFALHYGRFGFFFIWAPACAAAVLAHTAWAFRGRWGNLHLALAACWCALSLYGWTSGFVVPAIGAAYLLGILGLDKRAWKPRLPGLAAAFLLFLALGAPAIKAYLFFPGGMSGLLSGSSSSIFSAVSDDPEVAINLSTNLALQLKEMLVSGTRSAMHFMPGAPYVSASALFFAAAGFGMLLRRPWSAASLALLSACALGFLPAWVSNPAGRNVGRLIVLLFPLGVLFGLGWAALLESLRRSLPSARKQVMALSVLALALASLRGPLFYFRNYRENPEAIAANMGRSSFLARDVVKDLDDDEAVYFSERFNEAQSFLLLMPKRARQAPLREAPDFLRWMALEPKGTLVAGPLNRDWLPWMRFIQGKDALESELIEGPWDFKIPNTPLHFRTLTNSDFLALKLRWKRRFEGCGLRQTAPGRWEGLLWVARPAAYVIQVDQGSLLLDGKHRVEAGHPRKFQLQAVPYKVVVLGAHFQPRIQAGLPGVMPGVEWSEPVFRPSLGRHGLRKTLRAWGAHPDLPVWVGLAPVVTQRFNLWSFESDESPVVFPMEGAWEGQIRVPKDGRYYFSIRNSFLENAELKIGGKTFFHSLNGKEDYAHPAELRAGRPYAVEIRVPRIDADTSMRFLVQGEGGKFEVVPWEWLSPASLPPALSLPY